MEKPKLRLSRLDTTDASSLTPKPKALKAWLDGLPLGDMEASGFQVLTALQSYNRCRLQVDARLEALNVFGRLVQELTAGLAAKYRDSTFPLSERNRDRYSLVDQIFEELAYGFKWLVSDLLEEWRGKNGPGKEFFDVIRIAIVYLSRRMLAAYSTYSQEPGGAWMDLHQLYKLADRFKEEHVHGKKTTLNKQIDDIVHAYLRIVMLSITNPYHLMQGEAQLIYNYLNKWVAGCRIVPVTGYLVDKGDLLIDLDHDVPPQFVFQEKLEQPANCRTIDMSQLMLRFKETIAGLTTQKESAGGIANSNMTFNERIRRDMLFRLQTVWKHRIERGAPRTTTKNKIRLVSSLSACHHFIDEQREFYPESDEVRIHKPERTLEAAGSGLTLVPIDYEPWKDEHERNLVDAGIERRRLSLFTDDMDVWEKIFASRSHARELHDKHAVRYKDHLWQQVNTSHNGMGVRYEASENARVSVGNIIAYHPEQDESQWCLGVVTWMKEFARDRLDMGIRLLRGIPRPVAVRAISGAGCGSEYFRCLLLCPEDDVSGLVKIIVPASIYDIGTQLVLNFRDELKYVCLTDMMRTTTCYTLFAFNEIDIPLVEQTKIKEIKRA